MAIIGEKQGRDSFEFGAPPPGSSSYLRLTGLSLGGKRLGFLASGIVLMKGVRKAVRNPVPFRHEPRVCVAG